MIHLYAGEGKGKTSIAVGMTIRMLGAGKKVIFTQFMKGNQSSELNILKSLNQIEILKVNEDFGFYKSMDEIQKKKITAEHNRILRRILDIIIEEKDKLKFDKEIELLIVLDEITYPCQWGLVDEGLLKEILTKIPDQVELVMTGRNPKDYMIDLADYYSELGMKKHPYQKGITSRKGIEF